MRLTDTLVHLQHAFADLPSAKLRFASLDLSQSSQGGEPDDFLRSDCQPVHKLRKFQEHPRETGGSHPACWNKRGVGPYEIVFVIDAT